MIRNPACTADRLRAAAEFRREGELFECLLNVTWARSQRLMGMDTGLVYFPDEARRIALAQSLWQRHCTERRYVEI